MTIRSLFVGALAAFCAVAGLTFMESKAFAADPPAGSTPMPAANWLFVQTGTSFTSDGKTLVIKGIGAQTLMFSDRPERMTGDVPTAKFVDFWTKGKDDFEKDPPNATVSAVVDGKANLAVVELLNPRLAGDTLTYDIRPLSGPPPAAGQAVSLFIDWWYGPGPYWEGPPPYEGGHCWRNYWGHVHCHPYWAY